MDLMVSRSNFVQARIIRACGALGLVAALSACDVGLASRDPGVAVVDNKADPAATSANISSLSAIIARNPNDAQAYNTRGAAFAKTGHFSEAIADFTKAIQLQPDFAAAMTNRALAYRQTNRNDAALADFNRAIAANPSYGPAYLGRGNLERAQGSFDQALADLDQAIRFAPESAEALHARGLIRQRQGNHQAAISDFGAAIDRNPFAAPPYQARGQSYLALGQYQMALDDFNAALNVDNKNADAWAGRGVADEKLGHKTEAVESYQQAQTLDNGNAMARAGLVATAERQGVLIGFLVARLGLRRCRDRQEHAAGFVGDQSEANSFIEGDCPLILGIDDESKSPDSEAVRAHQSVGDKSAAKAFTLMLGRDRQPPQKHGGNDRIARQSLRQIRRRRIQWHARCGERVKSRDFARVIERHKASGYSAFDILKRQFPEITIERIHAGPKRAATMLARERLRDETRHRASRTRRR